LVEKSKKIKKSVPENGQITCMLGEGYFRTPRNAHKSAADTTAQSALRAQAGVVKRARPAYNEGVLGPRRAFLAVMTFQLSFHLRFSCPGSRSRSTKPDREKIVAAAGVDNLEALAEVVLVAAGAIKTF
jgi:hypothetical protein